MDWSAAQSSTLQQDPSRRGEHRLVDREARLRFLQVPLCNYSCGEHAGEAFCSLLVNLCAWRGLPLTSWLDSLKRLCCQLATTKPTSKPTLENKTERKVGGHEKHARVTSHGDCSVLARARCHQCFVCADLPQGNWSIKS